MASKDNRSVAEIGEETINLAEDPNVMIQQGLQKIPIPALGASRFNRDGCYISHAHCINLARDINGGLGFADYQYDCIDAHDPDQYPDDMLAVSRHVGARPCDEKPFWYTKHSQEKTFGSIDRKVKVIVKESFPHTRNRFTLMRRCQFPELRKDCKHAAIMFVGTNDMEKNQKQHWVKGPPGFLLQFEPKWSYRTGSNVEFYKWLVPESYDATEQKWFLSAWSAPNVNCDDLEELFESLCHGHCNLPGRTTSLLQISDTHFHSVMSRGVILEAMMYQLQIGASLPTSSDQDVVDRAAAAYLEIDHSIICEGFVEIGVAADLFGSEDIQQVVDRTDA